MASGPGEAEMLSQKWSRIHSANTGFHAAIHDTLSQLITYFK